jgi:hypothetical protein
VDRSKKLPNVIIKYNNGVYESTDLRYATADADGIHLVENAYDELPTIYTGSNALNVYREGTVSVGHDPIGPMDVVTKQYLENHISKPLDNAIVDSFSNVFNRYAGQVEDFMIVNDGDTAWIKYQFCIKRPKKICNFLMNKEINIKLSFDMDYITEYNSITEAIDNGSDIDAAYIYYKEMLNSDNMFSGIVEESGDSWFTVKIEATAGAGDSTRGLCQLFDANLITGILVSVV